MRRSLVLAASILFSAAVVAPAQEPTPRKHGWFSRLFGSSDRLPQYKNPKIRGLVLELQLPPQPIKLSETRQLPVNVRLTNRGDRAVELTFPTEQRIEIYLRDAAGEIVTRWSDNRAFAETNGSVLINPAEHLEYSETIATRDLAPNKVFTVEVFMPAYPELDAKRKSLTAL